MSCLLRKKRDRLLVGPKKGGGGGSSTARGWKQPHPLYEARPTPPSFIRNRNPRCVWQLRSVHLCYWYLLGRPRPWEDGYRDIGGTCPTSSPVRAAQVARRGVVRGGYTAWGPRQGTGREGSNLEQSRPHEGPKSPNWWPHISISRTPWLSSSHLAADGGGRLGLI